VLGLIGPALPDSFADLLKGAFVPLHINRWPYLPRLGNRLPIVLSIEQIAALLRILKEPTHTMVLLAVFTGLRVGELLGLKWKDVDFQKLEVHVIRSIVMQHVGDCKTEASRKPVPLDLRLSKVLSNWRLHSPYPTDEDSVFASPHSGEKLPYWPGSLYKAHLEPRKKSESCAISVGTRSGIRTRRS